VTCDEHGNMLSGTSIEAALVIMQAMNITAFGLNCIALDAPPLFARLRQYAKVPLLYLPNAGFPDEHGVYHTMPAELTKAHHELPALGVQYYGVCCGGTEAHIGGIKNAVGGAVIAPPAPIYQDVYADSRRVYHADVAPQVMQINTEVDAEEFAEEQFFAEGPLQLVVADELHDAVKRIYCGVAYDG